VNGALIVSAKHLALQLYHHDQMMKGGHFLLNAFSSP